MATSKDDRAPQAHAVVVGGSIAGLLAARVLQMSRSVSTFFAPSMVAKVLSLALRGASAQPPESKSSARSSCGSAPAA